MVKFNFKIFWALLLVIVMLMLTISGAMASEGSYVDLKKVYLSNGDLFFEYVPVTTKDGLVVCEMFFDEDILLSNIVSTPNKLNRIFKEDVNFAEGVYSFFVRCLVEDFVFESEGVMLSFGNGVTSEGDVSGEGVEVSESFLSDTSNLIFLVVVFLAAFILINSLRPKRDVKKNKRLRRFA